MEIGSFIQKKVNNIEEGGFQTMFCNKFSANTLFICANPIYHWHLRTLTQFEWKCNSRIIKGNFGIQKGTK